MGWRQCSSLAIFGLLCADAAATVESPAPSDSFVDSIGVNIHALHTSGPYADWTRIEQTISDLGIRYVRDIPDAYQKLNELSATTGVKVDVIMQDGETTSAAIDIDKVATVMQRTRSLNSIAYLEGPNEPDAFSDWQDRLMAWQTEIYQQSKADPYLGSKLMIGPSLGPWGPEVLPQLYYVLDAGNVHQYVEPYPVSYALDTKMWRASHRSGDKPIFVTEFGYSSAMNVPNTVPEDVAAKYIATGFFDTFSAGVKQSYVYELAQEGDDSNMNDVEAQLGLVRSDFSYKPAAVAMKNLINTVKDPGASFTPSSLDYSVSGGDVNLKHYLLQKHDGTFVLALWQDVQLWDADNHVPITISPQSIQLNFADAMTAAQVYEPTVSASATNSFPGVYSQLNFNVGDDLMLLEFNRQGSWKAPSAGTWQTASNWISGVPNGADAIAFLGPATASAHAISTDGSAITVGKLVFDDDAAYHITGSSTLTLASATTAAIDVRRGQHQIDLPVVIASNSTLSVASGAGLHIANVLSVEDNKMLTVAAGVVRADAVSLGTGSKIDLEANKMVTSAAINDVAALVKNARNGGNWDGSGITTLMPAAASGVTTLAVASAGEVGKTTFEGERVSPADTLIMYTYNGDANLDGKVDADDYFVIDSNYNHPGLGDDFAHGDFNYDGQINGDDYALIDAAFAAQTTTFSPVAAIPEPTGMLPLIFAAACGSRRRRR